MYKSYQGLESVDGEPVRESADRKIFRITALEFQDFSRLFQDLPYALFQEFPGPEAGNLNILISGLSRVCTNPAN